MCSKCLLLHCHGLLAGRGSIPVTAPSAVAGVGTRVGSWERNLEFHEEAILEVEGQVAVAETVREEGAGCGDSLWRARERPADHLPGGRVCGELG